MNQKYLTDKFNELKNAVRKTNMNSDSEWGWTSNSEIDTLWNINTDELYQRSHPNEEWNLIPSMRIKN